MYDTTPSLIVLEAVNKTLESLERKITKDRDTSNPENQTSSAWPKVDLANSLLTFIDKDKASKEDIKEAFCRDIDTFSWEFVKPERHSSNKSAENFFGKIIGIILIKWHTAKRTFRTVLKN